MENKELSTHTHNHSSCNICGVTVTSKCDEERHKETGFSLSLFTNFSTDSESFELDDQVKNYLNNQAVIF